MSKLQKNWVGFSINVPEQHPIIITGNWQDKDDHWWWKCRKCLDGSGVITSTEIERFDIKGFVAEPDGEMEPENSRHPKEQIGYDEDEELYRAYSFYGY